MAPAAPSLLPGQRFTSWDFGTLPELMEVTQTVAGRTQTVIGYPALVDRGDAVELELFDEPELAEREQRGGLIRLFALTFKEPLKFFEKNVPDFQKMSLLYASFGGADDLRRELSAALIERACLADPLPSTAEQFAARVAESRPRLNLIGQEVARQVLAALTEYQAAQRKLAQSKSFAQAHADVEQQLAALLPKRFITSTPADRLPHLPRYLKAIAMRFDKLRAEPARDAQKMTELAPLVVNYRRLLTQRRGQADARLDEFRWLLEELRVSLFAQELRTPMPVSVKRLQKAWAGLVG